MCECEREISHYTSKVFTSHLYFIKIEKYCPLCKLCYPQSIPNKHVLTDVFVSGSKPPRSSWLLHNLLVHPLTKYNRQVVRSPKERDFKTGQKTWTSKKHQTLSQNSRKFWNTLWENVGFYIGHFFSPQGAGHVFWSFWFDTISWPLKLFSGSYKSTKLRRSKWIIHLK